MKAALGIIPARFDSTRLPGKALLPIGGKAMILHVWERASQAQRLERVIVATDNTRIADTVRQAGGHVVMTRTDHRSGTDRCAEAAAQFPDFEWVVNIQGDEPFIDARQIDDLVESAMNVPSLQIASQKRRISDTSRMADVHCVKVVTDRANRALYFSRAAIPAKADTQMSVTSAYEHVGLYLYRAATLATISSLPETTLEKTERLEQLRWLEHGFPIHVFETRYTSWGVDTPADLEAAETFYQQQRGL